MDGIFKEGDRVYLCILGWGTVIETTKWDIVVNFDSIDNTRYVSGEVRKLLSFTEYTLEGFSQERPEELPKPGDIVWVRNEFPSEWEIGYFFKKEGNTYYTSASKNLQGWRSAGLEIRTTNPYANEQ
jgi:hypothetical protein